MYSGGPTGGHLAMATKTVIVEFQGPSRIVFFQEMKKKMENALAEMLWDTSFMFVFPTLSFFLTNIERHF